MVDAEHTQVRNSEGSALKLEKYDVVTRLQLIGSSFFGQSLHIL